MRFFPGVGVLLLCHSDNTKTEVATWLTRIFYVHVLAISGGVYDDQSLFESMIYQGDKSRDLKNCNGENGFFFACCPSG